MENNIIPGFYEITTTTAVKYHKACGSQEEFTQEMVFDYEEPFSIRQIFPDYAPLTIEDGIKEAKIKTLQAMLDHVRNGNDR